MRLHLSFISTLRVSITLFNAVTVSLYQLRNMVRLDGSAETSEERRPFEFKLWAPHPDSSIQSVKELFRLGKLYEVI